MISPGKRRVVAISLRFLGFVLLVSILPLSLMFAVFLGSNFFYVGILLSLFGFLLFIFVNDSPDKNGVN